MHYDCHALNITQDFFHPHTRTHTPIYQSYQWGHQTKKYNYSAVHTPARYWPQGGWWTVILPDWLRGSQGWVWSDPLPPRSSFIEAVNYTLASLTVLANGFVKTWFQIMALLRHTARKPYCHHKFYTIIYKKNIIINRRTGETMSELAGVFQLTHSSSDVNNRVLWRLLVSKQDNLNINDRSNIALMVS